jgi:hypothetical protein
MEHGIGAWCWAAQGTDKQSFMGQNAAGKMAEVVAPFIGPKRRWRGGERPAALHQRAGYGRGGEGAAI